MNDPATIESPEEYIHNITEADLPNVHFSCLVNTIPAGVFGLVFIFLNGQNILQLSLSSSGYDITVTEALCDRRVGPSLSAGTTTGTGYAVEYLVTQIIDGVESAVSNVVSDSFPQSVSEQNELIATVSHIVGVTEVTETRFYRRPAGGGAYGFVGSSFELDGGPFPTPYTMTFKDNGVEADYTHQPPDYIFEFLDDSESIPLTTAGRNIDSATGIIFQRRLIVSGGKNKEAIHSSRIIPRLFNFLDFTRDFPLNAECSLTFKCGSDGGAVVKRFLDIGPLAAFTTRGIYTNEKGALTPDNITMVKQADYVIDEIVPPLAVPGGVFFVDKKTGAITLIRASEEYVSFIGENVSVYSKHLFQNKRVVSWTYLGGMIPLLVAVMDDGTLNTFTYDRDQQMRAWTWHDTDGEFESVATYLDEDGIDRLVVIVKRSNGRFIERLPARFWEDVKDQYMVDNGVSFKNILNDATTPAGVITITPVTPEDFAGEMKITSTQATFTVGDGGAPGSVYRVFDRKGCAITMSLVTRNSDNEIIVQPIGKWDPTIVTIDKLYKCYTTLTGLSHLNGKSVSVLGDGFLVASPYNKYPGNSFNDLVVDSGELTLPKPYAIVHVGLPFVGDVETLDLETVEQTPVGMKSKITNSVYVDVLDSRGLYAAGRFPEDTDTGDELYTNTDMTPVEQYKVRNHAQQNNDLIGNRAKLPETCRYKVPISSDWQSNGRVCFRQVDPLAWEILAITPDIEIK